MSLEINLPEVLAEMEAQFALYEDALLNHRVDVLNKLFWSSEHTVRYGVAENLVGIDAIRAFRSTQPALGFTRILTNTVITTYGRDFATAMTEFRRVGGNKLGRQSQTWVRMPQGWCVVAAHVSLID
jgi:hypothetical protein